MKLMLSGCLLDSTYWMNTIDLMKLTGRAMRHFDDVTINCVNRMSIERGRQFIVEDAIEQNCDYLYFFDDDALMRYDPFGSLLSVMEEKPNAIAVSGICFQRGYPYQAMVYKFKDLAWGDRSGNQLVAPFPKEPFQVSSVGLGCCLIRVPMLQEIHDKLGNCFGYKEDFGTEDFFFFEKAFKAGFEVWVEPSVRATHLGDKVMIDESNVDQLRGEWMDVNVIPLIDGRARQGSFEMKGLKDGNTVHCVGSEQEG